MSAALLVDPGNIGDINLDQFVDWNAAGSDRILPPPRELLSCVYTCAPLCSCAGDERPDLGARVGAVAQDVPRRVVRVAPLHLLHVQHSCGAGTDGLTEPGTLL